MKKRNKIKFIVIILITLIAVVGILCTAFFTYASYGNDFCENYIETLQEVSSTDACEVKEVYRGADADKIITMKKNEDFKILQLTDIHLGGGYKSKKQDKKAIDAVYKLVTESNPDLIIITGDSVYSKLGKTYNRNNLYPMKCLVKLLDKFHKPWAMTYGNHEQEAFNTYEREYLMTTWYESSYCLNSWVNGIDGVTNQYIELLNSDGSINKSIFLLDSNAYLNDKEENGYDHIHSNQWAWAYFKQLMMEQNNDGVMPEALLFFHIPTYTQSTLWKKHLDDDPSVKYYYGYQEEKEGAPSAPAHDYYGADNFMKEINTKAVFVGHDHLNDWSMEYDGIRYTYGQTIDYLAYAGDFSRRGATEIIIKNDGSYDVEPIYLMNL